MCHDAATLAGIFGNLAYTSNPDIFGPYTLCQEGPQYWGRAPSRLGASPIFSVAKVSANEVNKAAGEALPRS
jgi:hypothetical protein